MLAKNFKRDLAQEDLGWLFVSPVKEITYTTRAVVPLVCLLVMLIRWGLGQQLPQVAIDLRDHGGTSGSSGGSGEEIESAGADARPQLELGEDSGGSDDGEGIPPPPTVNAHRVQPSPRTVRRGADIKAVPTVDLPCPDSGPDIVKISPLIGVAVAYVGMVFFNLGLNYGLDKLGDAVGKAMPSLFAELKAVPSSPLLDYQSGLTAIIAFTFFLG